jgi:hypothetical protein
MENQKVKIIPPHLCPPCFPALGVYDIQQNKIYIKGGLSNASYLQILKHENAHRKWFLNHQLIRKITILLFGNPALYYIASIVTTIIFLCSALWLESPVVYLGVLSIVLFYAHLIMFHIVFEIPAWRASGLWIKGINIKEILQAVGMDLSTMVTPFLLMGIGFWLFGPSAASVFLGYGLIISWILLIYIFLGTLVILRKSGSSG